MAVRRQAFSQDACELADPAGRQVFQHVRADDQPRREGGDLALRGGVEDVAADVHSGGPCGQIDDPDAAFQQQVAQMRTAGHRAGDTGADVDAR